MPQALILCIGGLLAAPLIGSNEPSQPSALLAEQHEGERYKEELQQGWVFFKQSQIDRAIEAFKQILEQPDATEKDRTQALFGLGLSYRFDRPVPQKGEARSVFQKLRQNYPTHPLAPWALMELGSLEHQRVSGGEEEARRYFQRVVDEYPESLAIHEAVLSIVNTYLYETTQASARKAMDILEAHLKAYPNNPLNTVMHFRADYTWSDILLDYEKALPHALALAEQKMSDPFRWSRHYWHVASIYHLRLKQPEKAIPWYQSIIEETPESPHVFAAKQMVQQLKQEHASSPNH